MLIFERAYIRIRTRSQPTLLLSTVGLLAGLLRVERRGVRVVDAHVSLPVDGGYRFEVYG